MHEAIHLLADATSRISALYAFANGNVFPIGNCTTNTKIIIFICGILKNFQCKIINNAAFEISITNAENKHLICFT